MNLAWGRRLPRLLLLGALLAGCRSVSKPTPTASPASTAQASLAAATATQPAQTAYPGAGQVPTAPYNPYPEAGSGAGQAAPATATVYNPYPAGTSAPVAPTVSLAPTVSVAPTKVASPTQAKTAVAQAPASATATSAYNPYPGAGTAPAGNPTPAPYNPYPGQGTAGANPTATPVPGGQASPTPRFGGTLTAAAATSTARVVTRTPGANNTAFPGQTGTPQPNPSPTNSFPTNTPTATLPPVPPTSTPALPTTPDAYRLHASDPAAVKLAAGKVQLVWFFAFWSGRCQELAPMVSGLERQYGDRVNFLYLDIDDPATLPFRRTLGFRLEPQFFLLDPTGKVLKQWAGQVTADQLIGEINAALR